MSQLSSNELLRKGDKEGWMEKRREALMCTQKDLEEAWERTLAKFKIVKPDERTKAEIAMVKRATAASKGSRFQFSRAFLEKNKPRTKSKLRKESYQSTNALTPKERARLALESMRNSDSESQGETKISSKTSKGSGKRKTRRKRKRRRTKKKRRRKRKKTRKRY
tara:strand:+ start:168 stop:662 length:495 start_codon:yes stop_codon:yes gene_type:complete